MTKSTIKDESQTVQKTASAAEALVEAVGKGETPIPVRKARRTAPRRLHAVPVKVHTHVKVDPRVMKEARAIIHNKLNSYEELVIIDAETVIVR